VPQLETDFAIKRRHESIELKAVADTDFKGTE
jgi:hypothetical protein